MNQIVKSSATSTKIQSYSMTKEISLNEQQVDFLLQLLDHALDNTFIDTTTLTIGKQIISKLEQE